MLKFPDIVVANKRKLKKAVKQMGYVSEIANEFADGYSGKFVVMENFHGTGNLQVMQHAPNTPFHNRVRNLPTKFAKCIRKGNPEHAKLVETE